MKKPFFLCPLILSSSLPPKTKQTTFQKQQKLTFFETRKTLPYLHTHTHVCNFDEPEPEKTRFLPLKK